jgi:hypothetical protein
MDNEHYKRLSACKNTYCIAYRYCKCLRAKRHKDSVVNRDIWTNYIPSRSNTDRCELFIGKEDNERG